MLGQHRNYIRSGVAQTGTTGEGGAFSNPKEQFGEKSMFNKDRWLPLCRDLPAPISHLCCSKTKKSPIHRMESRLKLFPMTATMAEESLVRKQAWARTGCNAFEGDKPMSKPMSFWTNQDVLTYIVQEDIPICSVYGDIVALDRDGMEYPAQMCAGCEKLRTTGAERTGCTFCAFGLHLERGETRFERLSRTHPRHYEFAISGGMWADNPHYDPTAPKMDGDWQNWNPRKIWVPGNGGLGLGEIFKMVNEIYGKKIYRW